MVITTDTKDMPLRTAGAAMRTRMKYKCQVLVARASLLTLLFAFLPALIFAQQAGESAANAPTRNMPPPPPSLPISFGDLIQVTVFGAPALSNSLRVNLWGPLGLP